MDVTNGPTARAYVQAWRTDCHSPTRRIWHFREAIQSQTRCASISENRGRLTEARDHRNAIKVLQAALKREEEDLTLS